MASRLPPGAAAEAVFVCVFMDFRSFLIYFWSPGSSTPYENYAPYVHSVIYSMYANLPKTFPIDSKSCHNNYGICCGELAGCVGVEFDNVQIMEMC